MDDIKPVLPDTAQVDFAEELTQARKDLQNAEGKIMQLELALLQSRDFAIGAAAEAGEPLHIEQCLLILKNNLVMQMHTLRVILHIFSDSRQH